MMHKKDYGLEAEIDEMNTTVARDYGWRRDAV